MAKLELKNNDGEVKYTIEYNRFSLVRMEKDGFNIQKIDSQPIATMVGLVKGGLYMHHPHIKDEEVGKLLDEIGDTTEFLKALAEIYKDAVEAMFNKEKKQGNLTWGRA